MKASEQAYAATAIRAAASGCWSGCTAIRMSSTRSLFRMQTCEQAYSAAAVRATTCRCWSGCTAIRVSTTRSLLRMQTCEQSPTAATIGSAAVVCMTIRCTAASMRAAEQTTAAIGHRRRTKRCHRQGGKSHTGQTNSNHTTLPPERTRNMIHAKHLDAHPDLWIRA